MRLRDIQHILRDDLPGLHLQAGSKQNSGIGVVTPLHRLRLQEALRSVSRVAPFKNEAVAALAHAALKEPGEPVLLLEELFNSFTSQVNAIRRRAADLLAVIDSILPEENAFSFAYQLPTGGQDLETLDKELNALKLIVDEPLARLEGGRTTLEALDRGSFLVELVAPTAAALTLIVLICRATAGRRPRRSSG